MNPNTQLLILHGIQLFSLLLIGIFIYVMVKEPRTLWSGVSFLFALAGLGILFLLLIFRYSDWLQAHTPIRFLLWLLMILFMLAVVLFPLLLVLTFFIQGIQVLRREGLRPQNLLSLLFAILLFAYLVFWPQLGDWQSNFAGRMIYAIVGLWIVYGLLLFAIYAISALLNLIHRRDNQNFDYIVVLGAGIRGERVTPLLAARLDRGIALLKKNKKALLILSGGQGPGEDITEGEAMARYALSRRVPPEKILVEKQSRNTRQNLEYSRELMERTHPRVAVVTTSYHVFRALLIARRMHLPCKGFGAKTKWYYTLNALIREYVGYVSLSYRLHIFVLVLLSGLVLLANILPRYLH